MVESWEGDKPITPIPTKCPDEDSKDFTVHIAHDKDCSKFYKCQGGKKVPKDGLLCPKMKSGGRLYFNPSLQVCDWPENVECHAPSKPVVDEQFEDEQIEENEETLEDDLPEDSVLNRLLMNQY